MPPGSTKLFSSGQRLVERVAERLERVDHRLLDPQPALDRERHAEVGADVEELVLDPSAAAPRSSAGQSPARTTPSSELSSSVVP